MLRTVVWDEVSPINGVSAEEIFENRMDLVYAKGDIFLVVNDYGVVSEIQIGKIIASNYNMDPGLDLQAIADLYMVKKKEEEERATMEEMTNEQLQEELAALSYEVMMLQAAQMNNEE